MAEKRNERVKPDLMALFELLEETFLKLYPFELKKLIESSQ